MKAYKRVFLIVLDSFGIGAEPDAAEFGESRLLYSMGTVLTAPPRTSRRK